MISVDLGVTDCNMSLSIFRPNLPTQFSICREISASAVTLSMIYVFVFVLFTLWLPYRHLLLLFIWDDL